MKKIVIIEGSARKQGNSNLLCEEFKKGAKASGNSVETLFVSDMNIHYCTGCNAHLKIGKCVYNDDMTTAIDKMLDADVLVFATPVYFYSMSGQLKVFIDRLVPNYTEMIGKEIYIFVTAWDSNSDNLQSTLEAVRGLTRDCLIDCKEVGVIMAGGVSELGDVKNTKYFEQAYQIGKNV